MKLTFLSFLLFSCLAIGQNKELLKKSIEADSLESKDITKTLLIREKLVEHKSDENYYYFKAKHEMTKAKAAYEKGDFETNLLHIKAAFQNSSKFNSNPDQIKFAAQIYNNYYYAYSLVGQWDKALKIANESYKFASKNLPNDESIIDLLQDLGFISNELRNYSESIIFYEKALKLTQKLQPKNFSEIALIHNGLGIGYSDSHFHTQSLYHYEKELEFLKKAKQADNSFLVQSLNNVIWENLSYGDQSKAESALLFLNTNFQKWYNEKDFTRINTPYPAKERKEYFKMMAYLCNLRVQVYKENITESKKFYDSIESVFQKLPIEIKKRDFETYLFARYEYVKLFNLNKNKKEQLHQEHIAFNKKTIELAHKYNSQHEELVASFLLAKTYYNYNMYSEALKTVEESKKIAVNFFHASRYTIQVLEAMVLQKMNKNEQSKEVLRLAFEKLLEKKLTNSNLKNLSYTDFKKFNSSTFVRNTINSARLYELIYEKTKNKEDLLIANNLYFIASDIFAEFYQKGKYNYSLNIFNQEIASGLLQTQLLINPNDQKKLKEILNRIENNSSQHLWNIFEIKSSQNLKVPASLIRKLNELVFEKNSVKEQIEKTSATAELKNRLGILEKEIAKTQLSINKKDASFEKFKSAGFTIETAQKKLLSNQLLVKYIVTDKQVFAFTIQKETIQLVNLGELDALKEVVNHYNKQIKTIDNLYLKTSKELHAQLIQPLLKTKSISSIIFIPEDFLTTVSFESLQDRNGKLLVQECKTSYAYSIKLWDILQTNNKNLSAENNIVTFAPNYSKIPTQIPTHGLVRAGLYDLVDAKKEARAISELLDGKLFENQEANRDNFLKSTTNFSLHHLAMHSQLEEDYSKSALVFASNEKVYFNELYQLNFPSKLVVLSACNTGIGKNENGEGLMSLSRALTYSGVKSSVYSLWQVPDKETSEIMISFYENLKKGQPKDEALANAKTTFITKNPMKQHPFYWAGFVVNGDVSPILSNNNWMIYLGIGLGIIVLLFLFRKKLF